MTLTTGKLGLEAKNYASWLKHFLSGNSLLFNYPVFQLQFITRVSEREIIWPTSFFLPWWALWWGTWMLLHKEFGVGNLTRNSQTCQNQNRKNTRQIKIITHTRQYLCSSTICLRSQSCKNFIIIREKIQREEIKFFLSQKLWQWTLITKTNIFYIMCTRFTMNYKTSQKFLNFSTCSYSQNFFFLKGKKKINVILSYLYCIVLHQCLILQSWLVFVSVLLSPTLFISKDQAPSVWSPTHIHDKTSSAVSQLDESSFCFSYLTAKKFKRN